jgi:ATP-binding cassette subfamily B protein
VSGPRRRLLAPEVVQTSAMDCGPAALKCLLEGFGIRASYGRLREACQTEVDGTSIDTLEEIANDLGLDAEQVLVPEDHVLLGAASALPAIAVVRQPDGLTHFVVLWRRLGGRVQVMDPAVGRHWRHAARVREELYVHEMAVPAADWRAWAGSEDFLAPLRARLARLGAPPGAIVEEALADASWRSLAALDAATRMAQTLVGAGGLRRGSEAERALVELFEDAKKAPGAPAGAVPPSFWSVRPAPADAEKLFARGAVLVRVHGTRAPAERGGLTPELAAALAEPPSRPGRALLGLLRADGALAPALLLGALVTAAVGSVLEAVLFRGLLEVGRDLAPLDERLGAIGALVLLLAVLAALEVPIAAETFRLGRHLEARLRLAFLAKIPRLGDRYFGSRPVSDMAERSHSLHQIRTLPQLAARLAHSGAEILATAAGIAWLDPRSAPLAAAAAAAAILVPLGFGRLIFDRDLRRRIHEGALASFYLDALRGLFPVRTHGAERALRREHEGLLVEWSRAARAVLRAGVGAEAAQALVGFVFAAWLLVDYLGRTQGGGGALLLAYWALALPALGGDIALLLRRYPDVRSTTLRLLEPLGALEDPPAEAPAEPRAGRPRGAAIRMEGVAVHAGGHVILEGIDLAIEPGSHVAVVGASGAGKSSLLALLLGFHRAAAGRVLLDGEPLEGPALERLRRETAWVDPAVQLWNRPLHENLAYGADREAARGLGPVVKEADLGGVLAGLPHGLATPLGEGGALVSGGEGQRVRFGRALSRSGARLVLLDEPFRGLDRERRRELLQRARAAWGEATMLCVTHDVGETRGFPRVLVVAGGKIVEDGAPEALAARAGSAYRALLEAEEAVREGLWSSAAWRRIRLEAGRIVEAARP